jgi:hypothetical protein
MKIPRFRVFKALIPNHIIQDQASANTGADPGAIKHDQPAGRLSADTIYATP